MTVQIKPFGMSQMTIGSSSDFHSKVVSIIKNDSPEVLHVENKIAAYISVTESLASIVNRRRALASTAQLKEADDTRDSAVGIIRSVTKACLTSFVTERKEAAQRLSLELAPYKNIRNHEYTKETAEVKGMLEVLDKKDNEKAIATLGLNAEVVALREANAVFELLFIGKAIEVSERMPQSDINSDEVVAEANALYTDIVQTINAYAIVQPTDKIKDFINLLNGLIVSYK